MFAPALDRSLVRHVELVELSGGRAMVILVTDTGRVENHIIALPPEPEDLQLDETTQMLNRMLADSPLEEAPAKIIEELEKFAARVEDRRQRRCGGAGTGTHEQDGERVFLEGTSNIVDEHKFSDLETVRQVIGALEHRRLLLEVLADALSLGGVSVRIGSENPMSQMQYCTVITAPYGASASPIGSLGVVGPTRMDYRRTIAAVHEVSANLGRMLTDLGI